MIHQHSTLTISLERESNYKQINQGEFISINYNVTQAKKNSITKN